MINAWEILETLGKHLDHSVELTLYGRAALALGFESHLTCHDTTKDVDAIIPLAQLESLRHDNQFWDALDKTNEDLQSRGLYITHTFSEMVSRFALIGSAPRRHSKSLPQSFSLPPINNRSHPD